LWADFAACVFDADTVLLAPIYEAGEQPLDGISHTTLAEAMRLHGHKDVVLTTEADLPGQLNGLARSGDYVVCLGAGSISAWAQALPDKLTTLAAKHA
jgi:UDP-N-acetylmuramate--alanine ligase